MADYPTMLPAFMGEWEFVNTTTPPPANAQLRLNNGGQDKATLLWVNNISFNGIDASAWLMGIDWLCHPPSGQERSFQVAKL